MGVRHHVLGGGSRSPWERPIVVDRSARCKVQALSAMSCAKTAELIDLPLGCGLQCAEDAQV